jgi:DNA repair protein RadA/Sms
MKAKTLYCCQDCGATSPKWLGRCTSCEAWNTLIEEPIGTPENTKDLQWIRLDNASSHPQKEERFLTGIAELDRSLGGGIVPDGFTLLGGDPGIGKSTLLLQMAKEVIKKQPHLTLLYASGEESISQIVSRSQRLGIEKNGSIILAAETILERIFSIVKETKPNLLVIDSLQTFSSGTLHSAPGSVSQLREVASRLMTLAKTDRIAVWLVGHVTKDGSIAGPKTVEHMVDTVLYFEGDGGQSHRLLRTVKNRFGSTFELGVFEMTAEGLQEVLNPSSLFLSERKNKISGTAIAASLEGTRPIFVELQALIVPSGLALPRRTAVGIDSARLSLLAAILERHLGITFSQQDLFFNVAGGLRISEPGCDLAACAALWSSRQNIALPNDWVWIGEVGLTGEVRKVPQMGLRLQEAKKLGFKTAVIPESSLKTLQSNDRNSVQILPIERIDSITKCF